MGCGGSSAAKGEEEKPTKVGLSTQADNEGSKASSQAAYVPLEGDPCIAPSKPVDPGVSGAEAKASVQRKPASPAKAENDATNSSVAWTADEPDCNKPAGPASANGQREPEYERVVSIGSDSAMGGGAEGGSTRRDSGNSGNSGNLGSFGRDAGGKAASREPSARGEWSRGDGTPPPAASGRHLNGHAGGGGAPKGVAPIPPATPGDEELTLDDPPSLERFQSSGSVHVETRHNGFMASFGEPSGGSAVELAAPAESTEVDAFIAEFADELESLEQSRAISRGQPQGFLNEVQGVGNGGGGHPGSSGSLPSCSSTSAPPVRAVAGWGDEREMQVERLPQSARAAGGGSNTQGNSNISDAQLEVVDAFIAEEMGDDDELDVSELQLEAFAEAPKPRVITVGTPRGLDSLKVESVESMTFGADDDVERFIVEEGD